VTRGLDWQLDLLGTYTVTTNNYNAVANSRTRLLTTAHTKPSQFVFTSRFPVTDPNNVLFLRRYRLATAPQLTSSTVDSQLKTATNSWRRLNVYWTQSHFTTDDQSISPSWYIHFCLTYTFFVDVGRPLWQEVGSVICINHLNRFSSVILLLALASYFISLTGLSKSKSLYDRRSVDQSVLVYSFLFDIYFFCRCRAPPLTRGRVRHLY
jgi:hypothetical protein